MSGWVGEWILIVLIIIIIIMIIIIIIIIVILIIITLFNHGKKFKAKSLWGRVQIKVKI